MRTFLVAAANQMEEVGERERQEGEEQRGKGLVDGESRKKRSCENDSRGEMSHR